MPSRSVRLQMLFKIGVLKNSTYLIGKDQCWSVFLIKLQVSGLQLYQKESPTLAFLCNMLNFKGQRFLQDTSPSCFRPAKNLPPLFHIQLYILYICCFKRKYYLSFFKIITARRTSRPNKTFLIERSECPTKAENWRGGTLFKPKSLNFPLPFDITCTNKLSPPAPTLIMDHMWEKRYL